MTAIPSRVRQLVDGVWQYVTFDEDGGGGSQPVGCFLQATGIDIHDGGSHPFLWNFLIDNPWDFNSLLAIPTGLGLTFAFDGSAATIATTEAGFWAFTLDLSFAADATWAGQLSLDQNTGAEHQCVGVGPNPRFTVSEVVQYPSGASIGPHAVTDTGATADPLTAIAQLEIVRLG